MKIFSKTHFQPNYFSILTDKNRPKPKNTIIFTGKAEYEYLSYLRGKSSLSDMAVREYTLKPLEKF